MNATLTIEPDQGVPQPTPAQLVDRDGFLVFTGTEPFDAVDVIMAVRADREESLAASRA
ncbi:hypothetical protein [Prosthecobacter sp.]|uniref:hypothetical protein n=1 Tax=Prosthecobacter sp. TaxID=1965333 RepID=UPI003782FC7D